LDRGIQGKGDIVFQFADYNTLEKVKSLSDTFRIEIVDLKIILEESKDKLMNVSWEKNEYTKDELLHHIIAHEMHHIGQLSVWARELDLSPVPANSIGRKLKSVQSN
jgi:uncharacterized damage-inducible protein DinB